MPLSPHYNHFFYLSYVFYPYFQVNIRLPTHVKAPKKEEMLKLFKKVDANNDGLLDFPEFLEAAR